MFLAVADRRSMLAGLLGIVWLAAPAPPATAGAEEGIRASTGKPSLTTRFTLDRPSDREGYENGMRTASLPVPIRQWPDLTPSARFGAVILHDRTCTYVLEGDGNAGYAITLDADANGDLTPDERRPLRPDEPGSLSVPGAVYTTFRYGPESTPLKLGVAPDDSPFAGVVMIYYETERRGVVQIGDRAMPFVLQGGNGRYDWDQDSVFFDLDGDGEIDTSNRESDERYAVEERYVGVGDTTYSFGVDAAGRTLTLTALPQRLAGRPRLDPGNPAPDFAFRDLDDATRRLSDFRGHVVLLQWWGLSCARCVREMPVLREVYERYGERGFEIVGIDRADSPESVREFVDARAIRWPQTLDGIDGPLFELYRFVGTPSYVLIDAEGTVVSRTLRARDLAGMLPALLPVEECSGDAAP